MAWKLVNEGNGNTYYLNTENGERIERKGVGANSGGYFDNSLKHDNMFRKGKKKQFDDVMIRFLETGEIPDAGTIGLDQNSGAWENLMRDFKTVMKSNDINIDEYAVSKGIVATEDNTLSENFFSMDKEGTVANDLYNTFKQANQDQYESGMLESQYMEKDLNKMVGMERQNLIDSIREDRKKMLKSGLSQSAIANREIQGMLQGQSIASEMGQGFLGERRNLEQMGAGIDSMSRVQAYESMGGGLGNAYGGIAAAGAGDMYDSILKYSRGGSRIQNYYDDMVKKQQGKF